MCIVFFLFSVCFYSCNDRPSYVLSDKMMENFLFDLYIAEAIIKNKADFHTDYKQKEILFYSVLDKYNVSEQEFNATLVWYNAHLEKFIKINEQLIIKYVFLIKKIKK